jgi:hypothetical protein
MQSGQNRPGFLLAGGLFFSATLFAGPGPQPIQFNRDIHPILSENCFACHGPDKNQRKGKLRLDVREVAMDRGAIVPGKTAESKLVERIFSDDPDERMPPPKAHKTLTGAQKDLLKRWIAAGAEYEPHWAYIKPHRFNPPATTDSRWARNPIDTFILEKLEARGIRPAPEADRATLLRRLSLDLVGLPPTPAEIKAFLADHGAKAYEREVDRLLASPHFGERMAVPWLDIVRFANTVGYHGDQNLNDFPYRDYVIQSFNDNKPFDQFTIEQLAGDLLPNPSVEARIATGFNRLNMVTREGGAQDKEYLAKYAADRVRTVSMTWLGSTMGCAECHDHKFDPFTSKDFYQMEAFFADMTQWGVYEDYEYTPNPDLRGVGNDHPFYPELEVTSPYLQHRILQLKGQVDQLAAQFVAACRSDPAKERLFENWRQAGAVFLKQSPDSWVSPAPEVTLRLKDTNAVASTNFTINPDATVSLSSLPKEKVQVVLPLPGMWLAAIRLEALPPKAGAENAGKKRRSASVRLTARLKTTEGTEQKLGFYDAEADHKEERYSNGYAIIGVKDVWQLSTNDRPQTAVYLLDKPVQVKQGYSLVLDLGGTSLVSLRASLSPFSALDPMDAGVNEPLKSAFRKKPRLGSRQSIALAVSYLLSAEPDAQLLGRARELAGEVRACRHGRVPTVVTVARREPRLTRVLPRGNWQNETGEIVQPAAPHFLPQIPVPQGRRLTRLDLAHWLVSPDNPLTARAVMNRLWKQFFGTGISAVVDDLGGQGEWPTHPELLDWLACEFMHPTFRSAQSRKSEPPRDWDFKHMVKLVVMSSTYRQDSNQRPDLKDIDPNNRLLASQSPRRLEAEFVRDNALFIAGILDEDIGGPSFFPYQPAGYYANLQFPDRDYYPEKDERQYRRGVYAHWQRTFLQPMLANFDAPSREECVASRNVSNTPQQALTLLNDPTFVEAARVFAARVLSGADRTDAQRLARAFQLALARSPRDNECQSLLAFLAVQRDFYRNSKDDSARLIKVGLAAVPKNQDLSELAAWTQVCRVILNLQETITRY